MVKDLNLLMNIALAMIAVLTLWLLLALRLGRVPEYGAWQQTRARFTPRFSPQRKVLLLMALILLLIVAVSGIMKPVNGGTYYLTALWGVAMAVAVYALAGRDDLRALRDAIRASWQAQRREWLLVLGLTVIALLLRVAGLGDFPIMMTADEENFWGMARMVAFRNSISPFSTGWFQHPYMMATLQGLSINLLGDSVFSYRLPTALLGALHIPALYGLARLLFGRRVARWSALILTFFLPHILFHRYGLNQPGDILMALLAFSLILRAWRTGRALDYTLCGVALGAAQFFYAAGLFSLILFVLFVAYTAVRYPDLIRRQADGLALTMAAFGLAVLPYYVYLLVNGLPLLPRSDIYLLEGVGGQPAPESPNVPASLYLEYLRLLGADFLRRYSTLIRDAYGAYMAIYDRGRYAFAQLPLFGAVSLAPLFVGMLLALRRLRDPRYLLPLSFVLLIPLPTIIAFPIPDYFRFVLALPFAALLLALGLAAIADVGRRVFAGRRGHILAGALIAAALVVEFGGYALRLNVPLPLMAQRQVLYREIAAEVRHYPPDTTFTLIFERGDSPYWSAVLRNAMSRTRAYDNYKFIREITDIPDRYHCNQQYVFLLSMQQMENPDYLLRRFAGGTMTIHTVDGQPLYGRYEWLDDCQPD